MTTPMTPDKNQTKGSDAMDTSTREAVRIAEKYLPFAGDERQKSLALEIIQAIALCEEELGREIIAGIAASQGTVQ